MKNSAASTAVVRDRKFAEPVAPNRLPDAPPPKPEPMSAPLPCWSSTRPMMASATSTWSTISTLVQKLISSPEARVHYLFPRLLRSRIAPGADRPHRFVRQHRSGKRALPQNRSQLPRDHFLGSPGIALG